MKLISISNEKGSLVAKFNIAHDNGRTTVDQNLVLTRTGTGQWTASMSMENFPEQSTATEAAVKLANWLDRLAQELVKHDFNEINLNKIPV